MAENADLERKGVVQSEVELGEEPPLERPIFLPTRGEVTPEMKNIQKEGEPVRWTLTISNWFQIMAFCKEHPIYAEVKEKKRRFNMHDVNARFTKPWTRSTGCGLSVLISRGDSLNAQLMLSHAWDEDLEELVDCVKDHATTKNVEVSIRLWFCCFANYQVGDSEGPTIKEQLKKDPFRNVIESESLKKKCGGQGMLAIHTTQADIYSRLWCVYEVSCALKKGVEVAFAVSDQYETKALEKMIIFSNFNAKECLFEQAARISVNTATATCSCPDDYKTIVGNILKEEGGFEHLDTQIAAFRKEVLTHICVVGLRTKENWSLFRYAWREVIVGLIDAEVNASSATLVESLEQIPPKFWKTDKNLLEDVNAKARSHKAVVQEAIKNGFLLQNASDELRAEKVVVLGSIEMDWRALEFASSELRADKEVVLTAIGRDWRAFEFASVELQANSEVVLATIERFAEFHLKDEKYGLFYRQVEGNKVVISALKKTHNIDSIMSHGMVFAIDKEVVLAAIRKSGCVVQGVSSRLHRYRGLVEIARREGYECLQ